jgi:hypothetical protein
MTNVLDEVDDILNEMEADNLDSDSVQSNFNDSELQDIMAEIESLEGEFETEVESESNLKPIVPIILPTEINAKKQIDLQSEIDQELEMSLKMRDQPIVTIPDNTASKVLSFDKKSLSSEVSFEAQGQMNLNLGFKIGEENVKLTIDPIKGLVLIMSGVELCINQEDGCKVTMDSGIKFIIPLTSPQSILKKKSA